MPKPRSRKPGWYWVKWRPWECADWSTWWSTTYPFLIGPRIPEPKEKRRG